MKHVKRTVTLALCGFLLAGCSARAQENGKRDKEFTCKAAEEVAAHARAPEVVSQAYTTLMRCPNAGGALAAAWANLPGDSAVLSELAIRSMYIQDRRILEATLPLVQIVGTSAAIRRHALDVVLALYRPSVAVSRSTWADPLHSSLASQSDYSQIPGEQPLTAADRQRIIDVFRQLSVTDPDLHWRQLAKRIADDLPTSP